MSLQQANYFSGAFDGKTLRRSILAMAKAGTAVHIGCSFSLVEILAVLHRDFLRYPGNDPDHQDRDYLALSKGHGVMAQYACMLERGWLDASHVEGYFSDGSALMGLSDSRTPGLEVTSGSLGHGFSVALGLALAAKRRGSQQRVYCIVGDGESNEGPIWEGAMLAAQHKLNSFITIIDENGLQAMGRTADIMDLGALDAKFASFGFETAVVDGHDEAALHATLTGFCNGEDERPKALIAKTIKGKGVSFMENNNAWHYSRLTDETFAQANRELED